MRTRNITITRQVNNELEDIVGRLNDKGIETNISAIIRECLFYGLPIVLRNKEGIIDEK